jgi:hypothetical protein
MNDRLGSFTALGDRQKPARSNGMDSSSPRHLEYQTEGEPQSKESIPLLLAD